MNVAKVRYCIKSHVFAFVDYQLIKETIMSFFKLFWN